MTYQYTIYKYLISKHLHIYTYTRSIADLIIDIEHLDILRIQSQLHPIPLPWPVAPVASWLHTREPVWWHQQPVPSVPGAFPLNWKKYQNLSNIIKL